MRSLFPITLLFLVPNLAFAPYAWSDADLTGATTNAQRLARGLPLLKPKWTDPTRVRRTAPSHAPKVLTPVPETVWKRGKISPVLASTGAKVGYLGASLSEKGSIQITQNATEALLVRFEIGSQSSIEEVIPLEILNGPKGLLAGIATGGTNFDPSSKDFGIFGSSADSTGSSNSYLTATSVHAAVETSIWDFYVSENELTATWLGEDKFSRSLEFLLTTSVDVGIVASPYDTSAFPDTQKLRFLFEDETK